MRKVLLLVGMAVVSVAASAGTIASLGSTFGPGTIAGTFNTVSAGNDNTTTASANTVDLTKSFTGVGFLSQLFSLTAGSYTEYYFTETVTNNTGIPWVGYKILISNPRPTGEALGGSLLLGLATIFDATQDPAPTASAFSTLLTYTSSLVEWTGGTVNPGDSITFTFSVDVGDASVAPNGPVFLLSQTPVTAPEPGSIGMMVVGLAAMVRLRGRGRERRCK